ncbi:MAG TPA: hypothetical protein VGG31_06550 [Candidatus Dormibacteraeota bacterium]|jgi:hypothetical protein
MDTGTLVTILVVALIVVVLLLLLRAATGRRRTPQLRPLSPGSRDRYMAEWDTIETKFIDAPEEAVRQAESMVLSVLRERGHPLAERDLPVEVRKAHRLGYDSKDRTEGMRQAMLHYRAVLERMVGPEDRTVREEETRREMA